MERSPVWAVLTAAAALVAPAGAAHADGRWVPIFAGTEVIEAEPFAFADGTGFAWTGYALVTTRNGGATWQPHPKPPGSLLMVSSRLGYSVDDDRRVHVTGDGARTWTRAGRLPKLGDGSGPLATGAGPGRIVHVHSPSGLATCGPVPGRSSTVLSSSDAGATWVTRSLPTQGEIYGISFADSRHGLLTIARVSGCDLATSEVWVTRDGGHRWRLAHACPATCRAHQVDASRVVVVEETKDTTANVALVSRDGGRTFRRTQELKSAPMPLRLCRVTDLGFAENDVTGYAATQACGIWRTTDGGVTWAAETAPASIGAYVAAFDAEHAVASTVAPHVVSTRGPDEG